MTVNYKNKKFQDMRRPFLRKQNFIQIAIEMGDFGTTKDFTSECGSRLFYLVTYLEVGAGGIVPSSYNYRC
jgi:hypothetical protein